MIQGERVRGGLRKCSWPSGRETGIKGTTQQCGKMAFSWSGRLGRAVIELDEPTPVLLLEPNCSPHDLISISYTFLTQFRGKQSFLIVRAFKIWKSL